MGDLESLPTEVFPAADEPAVVERFDAWKATVPTITRPPRFGTDEQTFGAGGDRTSLRLPDETSS